MGLDPSYLDSLPNTLVDMYAAVEIDILEDMARRISNYDYFIPAALHQNQKLQELGMVQEHIIQALSGMTGKTQQEIVDLLTEASEEAIEDDVEYYTRADVYKPDKVNTEALHKQLNSGLLMTQQAFKNITRTTPSSGGIQFIEALDRAWTQINVGGMDYNTSIQRAIKDLAKQGLNATNSKGKLIRGAIKYDKSGRVDTLEVAVRRAIVTGANQTAAKVQETLADELDVELVEVTAHGGARPSHAKWQGQVFSRNGDIEIDGVKYKDLRRATGYGSAGGLCGVNCRHTFNPYVPGTSRTWSEEQLKALEEKNIKYNGEEYTEYEASQIQRGIERDIRSLKRQIAAIEAGGGDASAERSQLKKANKAYTDFTEQTGLKKQTARTKVAQPETPTKTAKTNSGNLGNMPIENNGRNGIIREGEQLRIPQIPSSTVTEKINSGEYSTKQSKQQYLKHVEGSPQFEEYKKTRIKKGGNPQSVLSISEEEAREIILEKSGTGIVRVDRKGNAKPQESVNCGKVIGYYFAKGEYHETTKVTIHYGKRGTHIVPIRGDDFD